MTGKLNIQLTDEYILPTSGLPLIGALLERTFLHAQLSALSMEGLTDAAEISHGDTIASYIGLLAQGKNDFGWIESYRQDPFFQTALGLEHTPSEATLRHRMNQIARHDETLSILGKENVRFLQQLDSPITATSLSNGEERVTVDADHSPFDNSDTNKEGVSRTYKGVDGYNPGFAYMGQEGYVIHSELRNGKDHVQKGTPAFLHKALTSAQQVTGTSLLLRLDGGNDAAANREICEKLGVDYIIKRNLRQETPEAWLAIAEQQGTATEPREGKTMYTGKIQMRNSQGNSTWQVYQVVERTMTRDGQMLLVPEVTCDSYWVSMDLPVDETIELYHQHGTCEQFHSELKTDMDLERFPSGKFATNQMILTLGCFVYNLLRSIGQEALKGDDMPVKKKVFRRRLKTVIDQMVMFAGKFVQHARQLYLKISKHNPWHHCFQRLYQQFQL
ncbi:IS1380 family transposase [Salicibibacter cibarius]|uniref:IS1380 family transposase n=1 Tax=Salicibibacter cibarius TaxID=2743000 RepID=A0A7T7CDA1_9BACI|nr:IS1380 family transposase [Salicibibacter cibarius]QQK77765.1 IS1380 family transposase [Salicibibacter cibarius]